MNNLAILILSCDKYNDLWDGYFHQFEKYFDVDIPVYFGSNEISPNIKNPKIRNIKSGPDISWGLSFKKIIDQVNEEYILITLEDLYLCSKIDRTLMNKAQKMINGQELVRHLKYSGYIRGSKEVLPGVKILDADTPYRVTLCGVWQKKYLQSIIRSEENPWQFEICGSSRTKADDGFFALDEPLFRTVNLVEKGFWIKSSIKWALMQKIPVNPRSRKFKTLPKEIWSMVKNFYFDLMIKVPLEKKQLIVAKLKKYLVMN
jgi:hypothetical protein